MKNLVFTSLLAISLSACSQKTSNQNIITSDIDNFWHAYDKISATSDTLVQMSLLKSLYIDKGTQGLKNMMEAKRYTDEDYLYVMTSFPKFWTSIRENTYKAKSVSYDLEQGIQKLKTLYPDLKPAKIYFTVGALRSSGTTLENSVLIGTELAFTNAQTVTDELPDYFSHLRSYFDSEPGKNVVFLNIHEYIHTQQNSTIGNSLLAQALMEGVAEFVATKALNIESPNPQISYGRENDERIRIKFQPEMFSPNLDNWFWNSEDNEFGMRDLGYYIGFKICENRYNSATDKNEIIKEMIELDYNNEDELIKFVEASGYFTEPLQRIKETFEKSRPTVAHLGVIENGSKSVDFNINVLTVHFSEPMNVETRNFEYGPLGDDNVIRINSFLGFSDDGKSVSFGIDKLEPNKKYQIVVGPRFLSAKGVPLIPYLIEFETGDE